jgi:peptidoglycan/LPS O-acetylase OafA/YrhL
MLVILGHSRSPWLERIPGNWIFRNGELGVSVFFVISGFLITHLLLKESIRDGRISLRRFYLRRSFRIFPPFYAFLAVVAILGPWMHRVDATVRGLLVAATYSWNYFWAFVSAPEMWSLGHTWSLALEEQFYLLWPLSMKYFGKRTNLRISAAVVLLAPLSRVITYFVWPHARGQVSIMLHTRVDTIMLGCLLSLALHLKVGERIMGLAMNASSVVAATLFLLVLNPMGEMRWRGLYTMTIGLTLMAVAVGVVLLYAVFRHESVMGVCLNWPVLRHIGVISYSLYLWQQIFSGPYTGRFPLNLLWIIACAELSFWLVEKPSFRLRDVVERRLFPRRTAGRNAASQAV